MLRPPSTTCWHVPCQAPHIVAAVLCMLLSPAAPALLDYMIRHVCHIVHWPASKIGTICQHGLATLSMPHSYSSMQDPIQEC